jgi:hypothetical protein
MAGTGVENSKPVSKTCQVSPHETTAHDSPALNTQPQVSPPDRGLGAWGLSILKVSQLCLVPELSVPSNSKESAQRSVFVTEKHSLSAINPKPIL